MGLALQESREAVTTQTVLSIGNASSAALAANAARIGIVFCMGQGARITYSLASPAVLDQGLILQSGAASLFLNRADHGDMVTRAWNCISNIVGPTSTSIFEIIQT